MGVRQDWGTKLWRVNVGNRPLRFVEPEGYDSIEQAEAVGVAGIRETLEGGWPFVVKNVTRKQEHHMTHALPTLRVEMLVTGGLTRFLQRKWGVPQ